MGIRFTVWKVHAFTSFFLSEQEAEVEEERLRKEREARERRDVLTLGETREKIQALEARHRELQEEKQQLFLTLKKVLNEDENRKKQQQKESNEMYAMHNHNLVPQQGSFMPPRPMQGWFLRHCRRPSPLINR